MKHFYSDIILDIPESVYEPREDTELMAKELEKINLKSKHVLEVGCGSGMLSILMAKCGAKVTATDINPEAVKTTKLNAAANSVSVNCFASDLFENVKGKYDVIVFNPPYLPDDIDLNIVAKIRGEKNTVSLREKNIIRQWSGGPSGRESIEKFLADVKKYLKPSGVVLLLISSLTGEQEVLNLFTENDMNARVIVREKVPWEELLVVECHC